MGKISAVFARLKNIKNIEIILGCAALIIVLSVYFAFVSCSGNDAEHTNADVDLTNADYCTAIRVQLENAVSEIAGVGSCSVVINWDKSVTSGTSFGGTPSENPKPLGALIVCDGGDNTKVKLDVMFAVSTLLDLSVEKIIVYPKTTK